MTVRPDRLRHKDLGVWNRVAGAPALAVDDSGIGTRGGVSAGSAGTISLRGGMRIILAPPWAVAHYRVPTPYACNERSTRRH